MSRIGKQPIEIPDGVTVTMNDRTLEVKGPKGSLNLEASWEVEAKIEEKEIVVEKTGKTKNAPAIWGTTRALIQNMIVGVTEGFEKKLELHGVGYKMAVQGEKVNLGLGFSHPVEMDIPKGLEVSIEKETMTISGVDKQSTGEFAAKIRALRPVEPYKGKGFRYAGEYFVKKEGKKAVSEGE